jgi:hypothetical protein
MSGVPWTKFQDFYLRLGFLKTLVAALSPFRRSTTNDGIYHVLESPLFQTATSFPALSERIGSKIDWYSDQEKREGKPYVAEALLVESGCASWLFAVTPNTIYKILDWGHDVQFVGRGNQITERGLFLRGLLPKHSEGFFSGDLSWNPFIISPAEQLFFLYHLSEIDQVTVLLIDYLADKEEGEILESSDAARLTCRALVQVLNSAQPNLSPRSFPDFRVAYELARVIAQELGMMSELFPGEAVSTPGIRRVPKPLRIGKRAAPSVQGSTSRRKPNKNADHQTIPRFEQLVDLGFLTKPHADAQSIQAPQRRWRYAPTEKCRLWKSAKSEARVKDGNWLWTGFAQTAVGSLTRHKRQTTLVSVSEVIRLFSDAYEAVRRPIGHTPLDSVALRGMLSAALEGYAVEMETFHGLMLAVKKRSLLPDHAFFASGNELDTMFINLRPGFREKLEENKEQLVLGGVA